MTKYHFAQGNLILMFTFKNMILFMNESTTLR